MSVDLARKRARQQSSRTHALRLDPSWETNPESTTLLWTCQTCEGPSLPPPWLEQTNERCAAGKPTDHTEKTRARPLLVRQGLRACVRLRPAVPLLPSKRHRHRHRDTDTDTDTGQNEDNKTISETMNTDCTHVGLCRSCFKSVRTETTHVLTNDQDVLRNCT